MMKDLVFDHPVLVEKKMYRARSFMSVAFLGWLFALSSFVPEIRGDLVQYWPFDDGATNAASDTAQNAIAGGNVGELIDFDLNSAPNDTPGDWVTADLPPQLAHSTGALDFDPLTNGYVDGGNLAIVSDGLGGEATVSLWYKARTLSLGGGAGREEDGDRLLSFGGEVSCCNEEFDGAGVVRINEFGAVQVWPGGTGWRSVTLDEIEEGEWYHIALVWQGDQVTGYIDGVEGLTATSRFDFDTDLESTRTFGIGARYNTGGNSYGRAPDGTVDDVAVWDEALTEEQLKSLFDGSETPLTLSGLVGGQVRLQPGDADRDFDFDQLDLVQVQIAAKYLTGQPATWGEGDWDGGPGGSQDSPPQGNGLFDQLDIISALSAGKYLTGTYAAVNDGGQRNDGQTSIVYNPTTGELAVDAPAGTELTSINIDSSAGIFTGVAAQNLGGSFDNDGNDNIFKATFGSSFGSISFGNVAQSGLSKEFMLDDLTVVGSLAGGGDLGTVDLIYVPEPSSWLLLFVALVSLCFVTPRRCVGPGRHTHARRYRKFVAPQRDLLDLIADKRKTISSAV
jgi:hypothetical protein